MKEINPIEKAIDQEGTGIANQGLDQKTAKGRMRGVIIEVVIETTREEIGDEFSTQLITIRSN